MTPRWKPTLIGLLAAGTLLVQGCAVTGGTSPPSRFYILTPLPEAAEAQPVNQPEKNISVRLVGVNLAGYLDRPQIISRANPNRLELEEFNRWAEPLSENLARVLQENLSFLLAEDRVAVYGERFGSRADYLLSVDMLRLESTPSGAVHVRARWALGKSQKDPLLVRTSDFREQASGSDYDAVVAAESRALGKLSLEIATAIRGLK